QHSIFKLFTYTTLFRSLAKDHGAWESINYTQENVPECVLELTDGKKVPVVYDSVGKDTWEISLDCLQPRGLMVSFGNASGAVTGDRKSTRLNSSHVSIS